MRHQINYLHQDYNLLQNETFIKKAQLLNTNHFTRNRKMPLNKLIPHILTRKGTTLSIELKRYHQTIQQTMNQTNTNNDDDQPITKTGYLNQRKKLNPQALETLCDYHTTRLYTNNKPDLHLINGYLAIACDGSNTNLPTTKENLEKYGNTTSHGTKPQASLGLSCCYDVLNKVILNCTLNPPQFNEIAQIKNHLQKLPTLTDHIPTIILLDRAYPSLGLFVPWLENDQKFVIRLKKSNFKTERAQMKTLDEKVTLKLTPHRIAYHRGTEIYETLAQTPSICLRIVNILQKDGCYVSVVTNLDERFSALDVGHLYSLRWGVETAFDMLKNQLELENFSGVRPVLIEQDVFACVYLCNLVSDLVADAQVVYDSRGGVSMHRMVVNRGFAVGVLKDELILVVLDPDRVRGEARFLAMVSLVERQVLPVRPDRHFPRNKGNFAGKYCNTHKRCY